MISLNDFRDRMKAEIEKTRMIKSVHVSGKNLDDALKQAALELGLPLRAIDYEVLDRGSTRLLGRRNAPFRIIAYETPKAAIEKEKKSLEEEFDLQSYESDDAPVSADADGRFSVRLSAEGAWLKVFPPAGEGLPVNEEDVIAALLDRDITDPDTDMVNTAVIQADQIWIPVGDCDFNPANNAQCTLEVSDDALKVYVRIIEPGRGGADLTANEIRALLNSNRVIYGALDDAIQSVEDFPLYDVAILVAEGRAPVHGADAQIIYNFETESDKIHIQEREDGSVDYKELNKYQNVVKGQPLARKIPPESGKDGQTVYGRYIPARDGKDRAFDLGKNVALADDDSTVIATESGHVMLKGGEITVETILLISRNVDASVGNVNALGSVEIRGDVEDGFSIKAQGRIEVAGYVGKANLDAGGDIVVYRGINGGEGRDFGYISSGKSIWTSFIQNATVAAGEFVIVSNGIVNSDVRAQKKVLCKGKRAKIVGGHVRASEEVNAMILGSPGGAETLIEVGFDPEIKGEIELLEQQKNALNSERDTVELNLKGMLKLAKSQRGRLSKEKSRLLKELRLQYKQIGQKIKEVEDDIQKDQEYLESLVLNGKVSAARRVLAGVTLRIRDVEYVIKESYENPVTFILEGKYIRTIKFHDIEEDLTRR